MFVFLANHILYVLVALNVGAVLFMVAVLVLGAAAFAHLNVVPLGAEYILANVNVVPLGAIYVPLLAVV